MATITHAGTTFNTTAGNKNVVATPASGDLIVVIAPCTLAGGATNVTDNNSDGFGTYTQVDVDRTGFSTNGVLTVWVRNALVGSATSTTFTAAEAGSTGGGLSVFRVSGMTRFGSLAVRSSGGQSAGTAGTTPAPVLNNTPDSGNPIITAVCNGTNSTTTVTQRAGYTEAFDNGYSTPATGLETSFLNSGETSATLTFGSTTATAFASIAIELDTSAIPGPSITAFETTNWDSTTTPLTITVTGALTGDLIAVLYGGDNGTGGGNVSSTTVTTTGGSTSAWTEIEEHLQTTNEAWINLAWAEVTADGTVTISLARTQAAGQPWGGFAVLAKNHGGIGNHGFVANGTNETGNLTTSLDSVVAMLDIEWDNASLGNFTPGGAIPVQRAQGANVANYAGYWLAQAAGTRAYGITGLASNNNTIVFTEILAEAAVEAVPPRSTAVLQAVSRSAVI